MGHVCTIAGGRAGGGESSNAQKKHLKMCMAISDKPRFKEDRRKTGKQVVFDDLDDEIIDPEHDDPLVISGLLANYRVDRMLVDPGSSVDIIFLDAFRRMDLDYDHLESCGAELLAFTGDKIKPLGYILLRMTLGKAPTHKTVTLTFAVVDLSSAYNVILGRPFMKKFKIFLSIDQLAMKFATKDESVATVKANQVVARSCYNMSLRVPQASKEKNIREPTQQAKEGNVQGEEEGRKEEQVMVVGMDPREEDKEDRPEPAGAMVKVQLGISPQQCTKMGSELKLEVAESLKGLLKKNADLFAWKPSYMPGMDPALSCHRLAMTP